MVQAVHTLASYYTQKATYMTWVGISLKNGWYS